MSVPTFASVIGFALGVTDTMAGFSVSMLNLSGLLEETWTLVFSSWAFSTRTLIPTMFLPVSFTS